MRKLLLVFCCWGSVWAGSQTVRPAAVAGSFYPADAKELAQMVDGFVANAAPPAVPGLLAIVAPHAGYQFSGHVAGWSYALVKGRHYRRVVVVAPSHYEAFPFASVFDGAAYTTPLGTVPVDQAFAKKLAAGNSLMIKLSARGHMPEADKREHALEVQLPFLQRVLGGFELVPVVMGEQDYDTCRALGLALAKLADAETLLVASSDLSHYHTYDDAVKMDRKTLTAIGEWDYLSMSRNFAQRIWEACGGGPIIAVMMAVERLGANQAVVLKYANSGDVTADHSRVVGYGAVALAKGDSKKSEGPRLTLKEAEKTELLRLARRSVETAVREHKLFDYAPPASGPLAQERGAFVTLTKHGELRGCIGFVAPSEPLGLTVRDVAALAALRDRRFTPVSEAELPELDYEISALSAMRRVLDLKQIQTGRDGLVIRRKDAEGLLLPQVASEQHWDRMTFLRQTCRKAGLAADAWQDPETDIFSFTALVFGERRVRPLQAPDSRVPTTTMF